MLTRAFEIQTEVERILESRWLRESAQLRGLLRHVVDETLAGRQDGLKEYSLGREVFHRQPDYDPRNDAIVRVQASLLRKRLATYYEHEGRESTLHIELPRGGYVPSFREVEKEPPAVVAEPAKPPLATRAGFRWRSFGTGVAVGAVVVLAGFLLVGQWQARPPMPAPSVWGAFIQPGTESIVSFGVPLVYAGAGIFVRDTSVNILGDEGKGKLGSIGRLMGEPLRPQDDVYTGIGDMVGTHEIIRWLESHGVKASLANSHYLGHSDIAGKNLVVVSSARFQTLLQQMNFTNYFRFDGSTSNGGFFIEDPIAGEQRLYSPMTGTGVDTSYAVLSLWPGKQPENRILYLTGITTWATQGAAQFVTDAESIGDLQARLDADPPEGPRGRKSKFFQVLLRIEGKNNQVRTASYVTHRYLPPS